jgi:hypothetical protein
MAEQTHDLTVFQAISAVADRQGAGAMPRRRTTRAGCWLRWSPKDRHPDHRPPDSSGPIVSPSTTSSPQARP